MPISFQSLRREYSYCTYCTIHRDLHHRHQKLHHLAAGSVVFRVFAALLFISALYPAVSRFSTDT